MGPADSTGISRVPAYSGMRLSIPSDFAYGILTLCDAAFQHASAIFRHQFVDAPYNPRYASPHIGFGLMRVRSPLLAQSRFLSFPAGNEMFQFPALAPLVREVAESLPPGCPIRKSAPVTGICPLTRLIAACHVLHRFREPRHPSCALDAFLFSSFPSPDINRERRSYCEF